MPVDLSVEIAGLRLANPVLASSGTFGYGLEFAHLVDMNSLGGIVVKGLSLEPMEGAPAPRVCETPSGMLNAIGLQNVGVRAFVAEKLPKLSAYRTAIVAKEKGRRDPLLAGQFLNQSAYSFSKKCATFFPPCSV